MKDLFEKLGITPGPWEETPCSEGESCWCRIIRSKPLHEKYGDIDEILPVECDPIIITSGSIRQNNAAIVAAAPEMLEDLVELVNDAINHKYNELYPRYSRYRSDEWIEKHAEEFFTQEIAIIEKATGRKWEDIKELLEAKDERP